MICMVYLVPMRGLLITYGTLYEGLIYAVALENAECPTNQARQAFAYQFDVWSS